MRSSPHFPSTPLPIAFRRPAGRNRAREDDAMKKQYIVAFTIVCFLLTAGLCLAAAPASMDHGHAGQYSDRAFLSGMIGHHQGAVDMSTKILASTKDEQIKEWAKDIIDAQKKEIDKMNMMLKPLGGLDKVARDTMLRMDMTPYAGKDADSAFVAAMFDHHKDALDMSTSALMYSNDRQVLQLAEDIISSQVAEMTAFRLWQIDRAKKK